MPNHATVVGLDIGSSAVRGVQVTKSKDGTFRVDKIAESPLPLGTIVGGEVVEHATLVRTLVSLWKSARFSTRTVRLGVGSFAMKAVTGEENWDPDENLSKTLPYLSTVEQFVEEPDQLYLDWHTLGEYARNEVDPNDPDETRLQRKKLLLLGAGSRTGVDSLVGAALEARLKPISVDLNGLALIRAFDGEKMEKSQGRSAVDVSVDIGAEVLTIVLHKLSQPLYMRTVGDGAGSLVTTELQGELGVSFNKAEERKLEALSFDAQAAYESLNRSLEEGVDPLAAEDEAELRKVYDRYQRIIPIVNAGAGSIIRSINETVAHFLSGAPGGDLFSPSGFFLSGGGANMPSLADRIAAECGAPTAVSTPFTSYVSSKQMSKISPSMMERESEFTTAFGLAVGEGYSHA